MTAPKIINEISFHANPKKAVFFPRFFKAEPGGYAEGDKFLGVTVPIQRKIAKKYIDISLAEVQVLLNSPYHEHRLTGLIILTLKYPKADLVHKQAIYDFYIYNAKQGNVNNWDLVDTSAHKIVGAHLLKGDREQLKPLYNSGELWLERIAVISTFAFIDKNDFSDSILIAKKFLTHKHDLIHKAVGWMLREIGKRDESVLRQFLDAHAHEMPRTMLRYSIERLPNNIRKHYMLVKNS